MRTLSATLLAAQKAAVRRPYVEAKFDDFWGDRPRLRFTRYYTGAEVEGPSAVVVAADGSLNRARIDPSTNTLYTSRVSSPGSGSTYSSWTSHASVGAASYCALAARGSQLGLFWVDPDTLGIHYEWSFDNGATWGGTALLATAGAAAKHLAAAFNSVGDITVFWSEGAVVYRSRAQSGAGWGARTVWTLSVASITGLACEQQGDWGVVLCGTEVTTTHPKAWSCIYGDGLDQAANTWSSLSN